jgi:pimeloyl-ACP methyl ester carboxylesterase
VAHDPGAGPGFTVVHGAEDRMVHPDNARLLAERIPAARLELWEQTGHLFFTDEPGVDAAVSEFLRG